MTSAAKRLCEPEQQRKAKKSLPTGQQYCPALVSSHVKEFMVTRPKLIAILQCYQMCGGFAPAQLSQTKVEQSHDERANHAPNRPQ